MPGAGGGPPSPAPVRPRTHRPAGVCADADSGAAPLYSTDSEEAAQRDGHTLPPLTRRRLHAMLRALTPRRERIARCMALALDHAYAAEEVADIVTASLLVPTTPVPRKLARLHVVSDILYNAGAAPHAWRYRGAFETRLARVFAHLGAVLAALPGRLSAESTARQLARVLDCWDAWLVVPPPALAQFRALLKVPVDE